jgi:hypothetical protein
METSLLGSNLSRAARSAYDNQIDAFVEHAMFRRLEVGDLPAADYDRFVTNVVATHVKSPQLLAFLFAVSPPAAAENVCMNMLEELGISEGTDVGHDVGHPVMLGKLLAGAGLFHQLDECHTRAESALRRQVVEPLLYGTLMEVGLAALIEVTAFEYMLARLADRIAADVTAVATPNATTLLRLAEVGSRRADELIRAVHDGTIGASALAFSETADMTPRDAMEEISAALRPDPARARVLARVLHEHGTLDPQHCWPNLAFIGCWLGGSAGLQAAHLRQAFGTHTPQRDLGLIASEGRMTVPFADATAAGPLAIATTFYEFVAEETIDDPAPPMLLAHELEDGRRYYVILTAGNGLYRYDMNDIVEVQGFHARTPKVAFVRKGRDMVDVAGEKLHLDQIQAALHESERAAGIELWQYRIIPDVSQRVHDVLIEPTAATADAVQRDGQPFITAFDAALMRGNIEYASKRRSGRLAAPRLHVMPTGWSERECRRDFENGKREVQHKWRAIGDAWDDVNRRAVIATQPVTKRDAPSPAGLPAAADRRFV